MLTWRRKLGLKAIRAAEPPSMAVMPDPRVNAVFLPVVASIVSVFYHKVKNLSMGLQGNFLLPPRNERYANYADGSSTQFRISMLFLLQQSGRPLRCALPLSHA
jgi:hypothetical protein